MFFSGALYRSLILISNTIQHEQYVESFYWTSANIWITSNKTFAAGTAAD
jgi:hypothetical protein